jgi:hypothetical protein
MQGRKQLTSFHFSKISILFAVFTLVILRLVRRSLMVGHTLCETEGARLVTESRLKILADWAFVRASSALGSRNSGKELGQSPSAHVMEAGLASLDQLRNNAAERIRLAEAARTSQHKSLFIEMAERWLTLAERAEQTRDR